MYGRLLASHVFGTHVRQRESRVALAAAYQLMASHLIHDLRSLTSGRNLDDEVGKRVNLLLDLVRAAQRGADPVPGQPLDPPAAEGGAVRERGDRLANLERDEEVFDLVSRVRREDRSIDATRSWAKQAEAVLDDLRGSGWQGLEEPKKDFVRNDLETFLRRLERLDQTDEYRPGRRDSLTRR